MSLSASDLADPTIDIHALFTHFNRKFFNDRLGAVSVEWSNRMTLCAGICRFRSSNVRPVGGDPQPHRVSEIRITLSEKLLKFRPKQDTIETLLHEMIHAYLFVVGTHDRDEHGPDFQFWMRKINIAENTHISVYHTFVDEVAYWRQHWWKCQRCGRIIKRSMNRVPSKNDRWWAKHLRDCGGEFLKIKSPPEKKKKKRKRKGATTRGRGRGRGSGSGRGRGRGRGRGGKKPSPEKKDPRAEMMEKWFVTKKKKPEQQGEAQQVEREMDLVGCPRCSKRIVINQMNHHLDECLRSASPRVPVVMDLSDELETETDEDVEVGKKRSRKNSDGLDGPRRKRRRRTSPSSGAKSNGPADVIVLDEEDESVDSPALPPYEPFVLQVPDDLRFPIPPSSGDPSAPSAAVDSVPPAFVMDLPSGQEGGAVQAVPDLLSVDLTGIDIHQANAHLSEVVESGLLSEEELEQYLVRYTELMAAEERRRLQQLEDSRPPPPNPNLQVQSIPIPVRSTSSDQEVIVIDDDDGVPPPTAPVRRPGFFGPAQPAPRATFDHVGGRPLVSANPPSQVHRPPVAPRVPPQLLAPSDGAPIASRNLQNSLWQSIRDRHDERWRRERLGADQSDVGDPQQTPESQRGQPPSARLLIPPHPSDLRTGRGRPSPGKPLIPCPDAAAVARAKNHASYGSAVEQVTDQEACSLCGKVLSSSWSVEEKATHWLHCFDSF